MCLETIAEKNCCTQQIINFGADPIGGGSGAVGAIGLNMGGPSRGLLKSILLKETYTFLKSFNCEKTFWIQLLRDFKRIRLNIKRF